MQVSGLQAVATAAKSQLSPKCSTLKTLAYVALSLTYEYGLTNPVISKLNDVSSDERVTSTVYSSIEEIVAAVPDTDKLVPAGNGL